MSLCKTNQSTAIEATRKGYCGGLVSSVDRDGGVNIGKYRTKYNFFCRRYEDADWLAQKMSEENAGSFAMVHGTEVTIHTFGQS